MKKVIVTQGCFLLLCSMFVANSIGDEPGVARISNGKVTNVKRAILESKPSASSQIPFTPLYP